ncbi:acyl-CoA N-acyltransferase [Colletotrichum asianum]
MKKHLNDFHEMCADEKACEWSSLRHAESLESSKKLMENTFTSARQAPWLVTCAIMSSTYPTPDTEGGCCTKMIGCVRTTRASPWGLSVGYKIRSDCWGKGYATRALQLFLDEYWSQERMAPKSNVYVSPGPTATTVALDQSLAENTSGDGAQLGHVSSDNEDSNGDDIEITHLIAQVDPKNVGSMRVAEKCGGKFVTISEKSVKVWRFEEKRDMAVWKLDKPLKRVRQA